MASCIYCGASTGRLTDEHIISEGLGCREMLPDSVCESCNSTFGATFEAKAVNELAFFRNLLRIPGKDGGIPEYRCTGTFNGEAVEVTFSGDGEVIIPPRSLGRIEEPGVTGKQYRVFRKKEEHIIERNLRRKHHDLVWKRLPGDEGRTTVEVHAEFDAQVLCSPEMNRAVAKFGLNLIADAFGKESLAKRFEELRRFIRTGQYDGIVPAGIVWDETALRHIPRVPPKHVFILFRDGGRNRVVILVYLFSLFPFCVVASDPEVRTDAFSSRTIDPYIGRFVPLLATRSFPEVRLSQILAELPRGDLKQAIPAARAAHKWVLDASENLRSETGEHVLCYECGRVFEPLAETCPYCGKAPLPSKAVGQQ